LLAGVVLSFAHTIGEFGVVMMIGGNLPGETKVAAIAIYDEVESLNYAAANFYALVLFGVCFAILLTVYLINRKILMKIG
jgi:molybdate transport system permease protein